MMPSEDEIQAVERTLTEILKEGEGGRKAAARILAAAKQALQRIDRATQLPAAEAEKIVCKCPTCGRSHWRKGPP